MYAEPLLGEVLARLCYSEFRVKCAKVNIIIALLLGQQVYFNNHFSSADKLKPVWVGPFPILCVQANGTITIQHGQIHEQICICHVKPVPA